jgi:hypothetical protein
MRSMMLCAPLALWAGAAAAQVTADQLWQGFRDVLAAEGVTVTAQENRRGNALILRGGRIDAGDGAVVLLPEVTLTEMPGGSVTVTLPPRFPLTLDLPARPGDPDALTLDVSAPGLALTFRDLTPEVLDFDLTAQSITASLAPFVTVPGGTPAPEEVFVALAVADLTLRHRHSALEPKIGIDSQMGLGTLHAELRIDAPAESLKIDLVADLSRIDGSLQGMMPSGAQAQVAQIDRGEDGALAAVIDLLDKGAFLDMALVHGAASLSMEMTDRAPGPDALAMSVGDGGTTLRLDRSGVSYDARIGPSRIFYRGTDPEIPVPEFEATLDEYRTMARLGFPGGGTWGSAAGQANAGARPEAGDWALVYRLAGLALSPGLWDLADPGRILPRDPMTLALDLGGTYALDPKVLEPGWTSDPQAPPPFREITVALRELLVAGAGASVTGKGDVAVDFTTMRTVDDIPQAKGALSFVTMGANALVERLNRLGVMTADDLQAARMGLLFLGRIEGGQDRLVTTLEFDGKSVTLNGQRIR